MIHLQGDNGNAIVTFNPAKSYQSLVVSSSSLVGGNSCSVYLDSSSTGNIKDGLYEGGTYIPGTQSASFTFPGSDTSINGR
ncbi:hypothetical protein Q0590_12140 [Rhodocytophaga aerolata]|uniref:Uncharacterized protein n=1 Tax=Rhodocytophaga aerolata TaxID=455078 RepID=A0ABT8R6Q2_9BACT|nr:hypothetical protein [Rhodocytophaga aerolata]MDO1447009.1 hypothetical protein [Rhodocytophaga aerolata]